MQGTGPGTRTASTTIMQSTGGRKGQRVVSRGRAMHLRTGAYVLGQGCVLCHRGIYVGTGACPSGYGGSPQDSGAGVVAGSHCRCLLQPCFFIPHQLLELRQPGRSTPFLHQALTPPHTYCLQPSSSACKPPHPMTFCQVRWYFDPKTDWYYGGEPPEWTQAPPGLPDSAKFGVAPHEGGPVSQRLGVEGCVWRGGRRGVEWCVRRGRRGVARV